MRFVVSTIGTSTLTNSIDRDTEGDWHRILADSANLKENELPDESKDVIDTLVERAREKLSQNEVETHRRASAELNGIYGIYEGILSKETDDQHYLICTDTFQGQITGNLIKDFLERKGFEVNIFVPSSLSTKDTNSFTDGIKELIKWLEDNVPWRRDSGYQVIFNLVGGFKSLQGYMQTFGAFYADETVYIFEGSSDLIRIPRLPIQIDTTEIQKYRGQFAMMDVRAPCLMTEVTGVEHISKTLLYIMEDNGTTYVGLSAWGTLIWNRTKENLLKSDIDVIKDNSVQFALMDAGKFHLTSGLRGRNIPNALLEEQTESGKTCVEMSIWGKSVWDRAKSDLLSNTPLLQFPRLQYLETFSHDIKSYHHQLLDLQEALAKISIALQNTGGNTNVLKLNEQISGRNFEKLRGHNQIYTFRINDNFRVSYTDNDGSLILRRYGTHDDVYRDP